MWQCGQLCGLKSSTRTVWTESTTAAGIVVTNSPSSVNDNVRHIWVAFPDHWQSISPTRQESSITRANSAVQPKTSDSERKWGCFLCQRVAPVFSHTSMVHMHLLHRELARHAWPIQARPREESNSSEHWHIALTMPKVTGHSRLKGSFQQDGMLSQDAFEQLSDVILVAQWRPKKSWCLGWRHLLPLSTLWWTQDLELQRLCPEHHTLPDGCLIGSRIESSHRGFESERVVTTLPEKIAWMTDSLSRHSLTRHQLFRGKTRNQNIDCPQKKHISPVIFVQIAARTLQDRCKNWTVRHQRCACHICSISAISLTHWSSFWNVRERSACRVVIAPL